MANEVRIDLVAKGATQTARDIDRVGDAAGGAGDDLKGMAADAKILDKAIDDLNVKLVATRQELVKDPGNKGLWKELRSGEREMGKLTKLKKSVFGDDASIKDTGKQAGKLLGEGIGDALGAVPSQLKGAGIAIGAGLALLAAPIIGGAIAAAVVGGVGAGGIAGGIAAAAQDPRVKAAGSHLGESITDSFTGIGEPFIEPLIEQMGRLEGIGSAFFSGLSDDLAPLADHLDEFGDAAAEIGRNFDLSKVTDAAGPLLDVLAGQLPDVVQAVNDALDAMAGESEGAAIALVEVFDAAEAGIRITGNLVASLSAINEGLSEVNAVAEENVVLDGLLTALWSGMAGGLDILNDETEEYTGATIRGKDASKLLANELAGEAAATKRAAEELKTYSDAIDDAFGQQMSLAEATSQYKQGARDLHEELKTGKHTLNENTEAGLGHADAIRSQIQNIEDLRKSELAQTGDLKATTAAYEARIEKIRADAIALGYDKAAVDAIIGAWKGVPRNVETEYRIKTTFSGGGGEGGESHRGEHRAAGGPVMADRPYLVGEEGPELVTFAANGTVHTAAQTKAMLSGSSGGSAGPADGMTEAQLVRLIAATATAAATAVVNRAQVVMNGRAIGQMQADEADTYYRGG